MVRALPQFFALSLMAVAASAAPATRAACKQLGASFQTDIDKLFQMFGPGGATVDPNLETNVEYKNDLKNDQNIVNKLVLTGQVTAADGVFLSEMGGEAFSMTDNVETHPDAVVELRQLSEDLDALYQQVVASKCIQA